MRKWAFRVWRGPLRCSLLAGHGGGQVSLFYRAAAVTGVGLLLMLVALPFRSFDFEGNLLWLEEEFGEPRGTFEFHREEWWLLLFVVVVAGAVRRPMVMGWAVLPALPVVGWFVLVACDVQFETSFVSSGFDETLNADRSLAFGGWLNAVGMLVVLLGLLIPVLEWWRVRRLAPAITG
jgi:hypothetical protein